MLNKLIKLFKNNKILHSDFKSDNDPLESTESERAFYCQAARNLNKQAAALLDGLFWKSRNPAPRVTPPMIVCPMADKPPA